MVESEAALVRNQDPIPELVPKKLLIPALLSTLPRTLETDAC